MIPRRPWRTIKRNVAPRRRVSPRSVSPDRFGTHRQQVKYADGLWRDLVRRSEPSGLCPRCRKRAWSDAAHCFAKGPYPALRHDVDNGAPLCRTCHRRIDSDHHAKVDFFMRYIGRAAYERLELRAQSRAKSDIRLTILFLEQQKGA